MRLQGINVKCLLTMLVIFLFMTTSCSVNQQTTSGSKRTDGLQDSVLVDSENNRYAVRILKDSNLWMTDNLKLNIPGSYCYGDVAGNCGQYGRLYTWEAAQKGCSLLGKGWQLPANDDWLKLSRLYAYEDRDSVAVRKIAFQTLKGNGSAQFNAVLGGGRTLDGQYARLEAHGFYWTVTPNDDSTAWFANFAKGSQALYIQRDGEKERAFSVRCLKSMPK